MSWLLGSTTYVGEFLYGKGWPEPTQMREINEDKTKAISARMDAKVAMPRGTERPTIARMRKTSSR
jgi:hypothetical protein